MSDTNKLHLVIINRGTKHFYEVTAHNQSSDQAEALVDEFNPEAQPGSWLITLEQHRAHKTEDVRRCRACRETMLRVAESPSLAKFVRRKP